MNKRLTNNMSRSRSSSPIDYRPVVRTPDQSVEVVEEVAPIQTVWTPMVHLEQNYFTTMRVCTYQTHVTRYIFVYLVSSNPNPHLQVVSCAPMNI